MAKTGVNNKRNHKYEVELTPEQISYLKALLSLKETTLTIKKRALILLAIHKDFGKKLTQRQLAESLDVSPSTVLCTVKRFATMGFDDCMSHQHNSKSVPTRKILGEQEARLLQLACSQPPEGRSCWSLVLLRDKAVELKIIEPTSVGTVRSTLKKMNFSLTKMPTGVFPQNKMLNL